MFDCFCRLCKQAIQQIIDRGQGPPPMGGGGMDSMGEGSTVVELNIPGTKVGLIIGKGGETIRQLQVGWGYKKNNVLTKDDWCVDTK